MLGAGSFVFIALSGLFIRDSAFFMSIESSPNASANICVGSSKSTGVSASSTSCAIPISSKVCAVLAATRTASFKSCCVFIASFCFLGYVGGIGVSKSGTTTTASGICDSSGVCFFTMSSSSEFI